MLETIWNDMLIVAIGSTGWSLILFLLKKIIDIIVVCLVFYPRDKDFNNKKENNND